ncbi:Acetyltransferase (GNAT) family protein [Paenimyroides ummariense]|uniref:Acetyltransferase (GNAT) family protein n=1 Tax=Paenimyroides ummariense TaxID=913024 RepID=A0A1I4W5W0_9FLAO|nr:GNAT family N-acetyltransferase [Paenimyroides ummariense]SFN08961.1 Acetyltransferase (GNAT) family protein [Paenimyroides ummariense]
MSNFVIVEIKKMNMLEIKTYSQENKPDQNEKETILNFLFKNLEQYGDPKQDIEKCMNYALNETPSFGGFIVTASLENNIAGAVIVNETGMKDYIPENILVYIATDANQRGKGIGKALMQHAIDNAKGNIALHVEPDNPAIKLYEKLGFTNKYLEMRLNK